MALQRTYFMLSSFEPPVFLLSVALGLFEDATLSREDALTLLVRIEADDRRARRRRRLERHHRDRLGVEVLWLGVFRLRT